LARSFVESKSTVHQPQSGKLLVLVVDWKEDAG
jgi:hypothetical protein